MVSKGHLDEPLGHRPEARDHLLGSRGRNRRGRSSVKTAFEGHNLDPVGRAFVEPILPRHLDRQFRRLGARVGKEHVIGKTRFDQPVGQFDLARNFIQVRHMPKRVGLLCQGCRQHRIGMAQQRDRNARAQVQETSPICLDQPRAFALYEL